MDAQKMGQSLDMDQLENVSGGTYMESLALAKFLKKAGFEDTLNPGSNTVDYGGTNAALKELGFTAKHNTGSVGNTYKDENGKSYTQTEMMDFLKKKYPDVK